jgi:hypothetical protein
MKKCLFTLVLLGPALLGSSCDDTVANSALLGLGKYVSETVYNLLITFLPLGQ